MISIIHPSRSRPEKSYENIRLWNHHFSGRPESLETIVSIDNNDPYYHEYKRWHGINVIANDNLSAVDAVNNAAKVAKGDIFIVVSDDTRSYPGWNRDIYDTIKGKIDWVIKTDDGIQNRIITMPIMDPTYYKRRGFIYNPAFRHSWVDTELTEVAHRLGRVIDARHLKFPHNHYSVTGEKPDELYKRNDKTHDEDRHIYEDLKRRGFPE